MASASKQHDLETFQVDAFTSRAFGGNPAEVVLVPEQNQSGGGWPEWLTDQAMQAIAAENNLSETSFVQPILDPEASQQQLNHADTADDSAWRSNTRFRLRWFTPTTEVNLCGHATLATACVLFRTKHNAHKQIKFETLSGELTVDDRASDAGFEMQFPANPPEVVDAWQDDAMIVAVVDAVLGPKDTPGRREVELVALSTSTRKLLVHVAHTPDAPYLSDISPKLALMSAAHDGSLIKGVIVTTEAPTAEGGAGAEADQVDFVSRYFAPWNGIDEGTCAVCYYYCC
jgi:PhzF family phenazine biosynthesis protein